MNLSGPHPGAMGPIAYCRNHCVWMMWADRHRGCVICQWERPVPTQLDLFQWRAANA